MEARKTYNNNLIQQKEEFNRLIQNKITVKVETKENPERGLYLNWLSKTNSENTGENLLRVIYLFTQNADNWKKMDPEIKKQMYEQEFKRQQEEKRQRADIPKDYFSKLLGAEHNQNTKKGHTKYN